MKDLLSNSIEKKLYFLALVPPDDIKARVTAIKKQIAEKYSSKAALKSPPHITLIAPFYFDVKNEHLLVSAVEKFSPPEKGFRVELQNFEAFSPRVIYIGIVENEDLVRLQNSLERHLKDMSGVENKRGKRYPFSPHMTVATRDLTRRNFHLAWREYKEKKFFESFRVEGLTLLKHNGSYWEERFTSEFEKR